MMKKIKSILLFFAVFCLALSCSNSDELPIISALGTVKESTLLLDTDTLEVRPQNGILDPFAKGDRAVIYFTSDEITNADSINKAKIYNITVDRIERIETSAIELDSEQNGDYIQFASLNKSWLTFDYLNFDFNYFMLDSVNNFKLIRDTKTVSPIDTINLEFMHYPSIIDSVKVTNRKLISFKLDENTLIPAGKDTVVLIVKILTSPDINSETVSVTTNRFIYTRK